MDQIVALPIPPQTKPKKPMREPNKKQVAVMTVTNKHNDNIKTESKSISLTVSQAIEDVNEHTSDEDIEDLLPSPPATVISTAKVRSKSKSDATKSKKKKTKKGGSKHYHRKKQQKVKSKRKKNMNSKHNHNHKKKTENSHDNESNVEDGGMSIFGSLNDDDWYHYFTMIMIFKDVAGCFVIGYTIWGIHYVQFTVFSRCLLYFILALIMSIIHLVILFIMDEAIRALIGISVCILCQVGLINTFRKIVSLSKQFTSNNSVTLKINH